MFKKVILVIRALNIFKDSEIICLWVYHNPKRAFLKISGNSGSCDSVIFKLIWILLNVFFVKRLTYWENLLSTPRGGRGSQSRLCFKHEVMNVKDRETMKNKCICTLQVGIGSILISWNIWGQYLKWVGAVVFAVLIVTGRTKCEGMASGMGDVVMIPGSSVK